MRSSSLARFALLLPFALVAVLAAAPPAARGADDGEAAVSTAALQTGLQALRENADAVGLEHLAGTAAMSGSTEALPVRSATSSGPEAPRGGLLTPAR